jgi:hypothetical protein
MTVSTEFLDFSADKLAELMSRIETCVQNLTREQIWMRASTNQNAVGNLLLHLNGNVRQWILHGVGSQPDVRDRDGEFAAEGESGAAEMLARLRMTVDEAAALFRALPHQRLMERFWVQGYEVTVLAAIYHIVEHFAGHTYQIIYATKLFTGKDLGFYAHLSGGGRENSPLP